MTSKQASSTRPVGKFVAGDYYIHVSSVADCPSDMVEDYIRPARDVLSQEGIADVANVIKIAQSQKTVSFLCYPEFEDAPFPSLKESWIVNLTTSQIRYRTYKNSSNPPILHRKELLVNATHPDRKEWAKLTKQAEEIGLFEEHVSIGYQAQWLDLISRKGYQLTATGLIPVGNDIPTDTHPIEITERIDRHLTAINRSALSAPIQFLVRNGIITKQTSVFDYGCGKGDDIAGLREAGIMCSGWDPYFLQEGLKTSADIVNLGFVVNVIEDQTERHEAMKNAFQLAKKLLIVSVMLFSKERPGKPYKDGFITSRNTFQKYFSQEEFSDYLQKVLGVQPYLVAPGIALVFKDSDTEQAYNAQNYRQSNLAGRLLAAKASSHLLGRPRSERTRVRIPKKNRLELLYEQHKKSLDEIWRLTLDLGREPDSEELLGMDGEIDVRYADIRRIFQTYYDQEALISAEKQRREDLLVFFASSLFSKRKRFSTLEKRIQKDVRAFFRSINNVNDAAVDLLADCVDKQKIEISCAQATDDGLGWLFTGHSFQFHKSVLSRLPVLLRIYVNCGLLLYQNASDFDLIKIHITSGKLSLMQYDDFEGNRIPNLIERVKINIPKLDYDIFTYDSAEFPPAPLFLKSRYLDEEFVGYERQALFDEKLLSLVGDEKLLSRSIQEVSSLIQQYRYRLSSKELSRVRELPDLDEKCGKYFKFRDLVECGETQKKLSVDNVPKEAETYNAYCDLFNLLIDPVIDYFGMIVLTYGFASKQLTKNIQGRIYPSLDQHAGHEKENSKLICQRKGAAVDFLIEDEDMREVASWIASHLPFDRIYIYGPHRPIHISYSQNPKREMIIMEETKTGRLVPRKVH